MKDATNKKQNNLPNATVENGLLIATPNGDKLIETLTIGDAVSSASIELAGNKVQLKWSNELVDKMFDTKKKVNPFTVYINYGDDTQAMVCTSEQPFLLSNGKCIIAERLRPGMYLIDKKGKHVRLNALSFGSYEGGEYAFSTNKPWTKNIEGRLILMNGVVAGDYLLQKKFNQLPDSLKEDLNS